MRFDEHGRQFVDPEHNNEAEAQPFVVGQWKVECADGISFWVTSREEATARFWDAVSRSRINGVWKLFRPDGTEFLIVTALGIERMSLTQARAR